MCLYVFKPAKNKILQSISMLNEKKEVKRREKENDKKHASRIHL